MLNAGDPLHILKTRFGYDHFRPLQDEIIANVLAGSDTLVLMPTGGGKSLCYQLPALCLDGLTLVISPLIALMKDQVDGLKANGIPAEFINSSLTASEIARVQTQARRGGTKILYLAPERLALSAFRDFLCALNISLIAIDEAHCISEWGHEFRPDYRNLKMLRQDFPQTPVIALTATATERVREDIVGQLSLQEGRTFISSFNRANLAYLVQPKDSAFTSLLALLRKRRDQPAIIYCFSRKDTEALAADLNAQGFKALPYHAGLDNPVRIETQEKFIRDQVPIIVATIAFGMGIDKPDIRLVVHYALPKSLEGYYQETGRAGRDGLPSDCVLFYSFGDKIKQDYFIDRMEDDAERGNARQKLVQMIEFCELHTCRRRFILEYFSEQWEEENCGGCDVCLTDREEFDATEIAQKILSAVIRTGERFGANHVIGVLRGDKTKRVLAQGHDQLSVHGIAPDFSADELKQIVGLLSAKGLLVKSEDQYQTLAVSQPGRSFLRQRERLTLTRPKSDPEVTPTHDAAAPEYDRTLFEQLRTLRKRIADERNVPPYVIFGDAALQQMAVYFPQSRESFSRISGVGKAKLEQFSDEFLAAITDYARANDLPERDIPARRRERDREESRDRTRSVQRKGSTYDATKQLLLQKLSISEIAQHRGLAETTIVNHLEHLAMARETLDLDHLLPPPEYMAKIEAAFLECGSQFLAPVMDHLGGAFAYAELRLARLYLWETGRLTDQQ